MQLTKKDIKKIGRVKGYAGIFPRLWFAFMAAALLMFFIIVPIVGYYTCYYCEFQFWEKIAVVLIPVAVGFASILLAIAGSAPKIRFRLVEKQFGQYTDDKGKIKMKQYLNIENEHGLPVEVEVTVYYGPRENLSTENINEAEYRYPEKGREKIKLAPKAGFINASFHIENIMAYNEGDLLLVKISGRNTFAKLRNLYQLWYFDEKKWVPDVFFRKFN